MYRYRQRVRGGRIVGRVLYCILAVGMTDCATQEARDIKQKVVFAPTLASAAQVDGGMGWSIHVQGRIFIPVEGQLGREAVISALAPVVSARADNQLFRERAGDLVSDSVSMVRVVVEAGNRVVEIGPSDSSGCISGELNLTSGVAASLARNDVVAFESLPPSINAPRFNGTAVLVAPEGVTVVTDMDDTIKDTNVRVRSEAVANTFVRPFRPVPGMPELYQRWQTAGGAQVHFHVVSAGPWQLFEPLRQFTEAAGFPAFTWDMRCVDATQPKVIFEEAVIANPQRIYDFKVDAINRLMTRFPKRHVVLIGDSGERDPEVYATIVQRFGDRVDAIYIHNVSGEGPRDVRYSNLYGPLNALSRLQVYQSPSELPQVLTTANRF